MTRQLQRPQASTNGSFGGHICKRQPVGSFETKKRVDKVYRLQEKMHGKPMARAQRAVTNRMITDIDMIGTARKAVEVVKLATRLRRNRALLAECVRTLATRDGVRQKCWSPTHHLHPAFDEATCAE